MEIQLKETDKTIELNLKENNFNATFSLTKEDVAKLKSVVDAYLEKDKPKAATFIYNKRTKKLVPVEDHNQ